MSNSSSNSSYTVTNSCFSSGNALFIFTAFMATNLLMTPLFIFVLYLGYQRWTKQRSGSRATTSSHSDIFTYNVIALELISLLGCFFYSSGSLMNLPSLILVTLDMFSFTSTGQSVFHVFSCVEHYLAVVHPVMYLSLRQSGGVRIRNISVGCVWLLCFAELGKSKVLSPSTNVITQCCISISCLSVVSFCSVSILWTLIRPGPGEGGGDRERVDQSKKRAFYTVTAILGVLWLRFLGLLIGSVLTSTTYIKCLVISSATWLTLPCSLVLPLLFLHRAGKLPGCKTPA